MSVRVGAGLDVHPVDPDRPLVLGGVRLPEGPGLAGHSDADVLTHAVIDALLGALAMGDVGERFGVDRPELAGVDSLQLLAEVVEELLAAGWRLGNLHATVVAQAPRLSPHREAMRTSLARALRAETDRVGLSFTTTDRLGSIGRGEGMACWATCAIERPG